MKRLCSGATASLLSAVRKLGKTMGAQDRPYPDRAQRRIAHARAATQLDGLRTAVRVPRGRLHDTAAEQCRDSSEERIAGLVPLGGCGRQAGGCDAAAQGDKGQVVWSREVEGSPQSFDVAERVEPPVSEPSQRMQSAMRSACGLQIKFT
eukprot:SAG11_NODE_1268_length_5342_cov_1.710853_6_plen_150_part_00